MMMTIVAFVFSLVVDAARIHPAVMKQYLDKLDGVVETNVAVDCETVTSGECFDAVKWAKDTGIIQHPEWYPAPLSASSSLEDFQHHLHNIEQGGCPPPCSISPWQNPTPPSPPPLGGPFEEYAAATLEKNCPPVVFRSTCPDNQFKGIVLFFHGYSSCSVQAVTLKDELTSRCMDIIAPTHPGHGDEIMQDCLSNKCSVQDQNKGWTHARLPTHRSKYEAYADEVGAVALKELAFRQQLTGVTTAEAHISGLSFGAPLALHVVQQNPGAFKRMLLLNPYFALGDENDDQKSYECDKAVEEGTKTKAECMKLKVNMRLDDFGLSGDSFVTKVIFGSSEEVVVKNLFRTFAAMSDRFGNEPDPYSDPTYGPVMAKQVTWGGNCPLIFSHNKGGFCAFRLSHMLASHSFAMHSIVEAHRWNKWSRVGPPDTQFILTERDGMSRNGVSWKLGRRLKAVEDQSGEVDMCMYRFKKGIKRSDPAQYWNDANSLPHAFMQPKGNWWDFIYERIGGYLGSDYEQLMDSTLPTWDGSPKQCVSMPLTESAMTDFPELDYIFLEGVTPTSERDLQWNHLLR